jgi:hypothetical protein
MTEPVGEGDLIIVIDGDYAMRLPCRKTREKCDVRAETRLLRSPSETCSPDELRDLRAARGLPTALVEAEAQAANRKNCRGAGPERIRLHGENEPRVDTHPRFSVLIRGERVWL